MCIICNCDEKGGDFLCEFERARRSMSAACKAIRICSEATDDEVAKKRYDKAHKYMVRVLRKWNKAEEIRENIEI